jgi:flagellar basal-body rod modification protein FlgD
MIKVGDRTYTGSTDSAASTSTSKSKSTSTTDTSGQFMSLLLAQLTNQNPLEPMDDTQMVAQMVSMNSLEELQKISKAMTTMSQTNQFLSGATLMDKTVTYLNDNDEEVTGKVSGVTMGKTDILLTVDEKSVAMSKLVSVKSSADLDEVEA